VNVVDSSGWLEYFANGKNASYFAPAIEDTARLVVPTLSLFEVFKRMLQQHGEAIALQAIALMHQGQLVELDGPLAPRRSTVEPSRTTAACGQRHPCDSPLGRRDALDTGRRLQKARERPLRRCVSVTRLA
jgi:hypothetical protein